MVSKSHWDFEYWCPLYSYFFKGWQTYFGLIIIIFQIICTSKNISHCDNTCDLSAPIVSWHNDPGKTKLNEQEESLEEVGAPIDFTKHQATIIKHHNCLLYRDSHQGYITTSSWCLEVATSWMLYKVLYALYAFEMLSVWDPCMEMALSLFF